MKYTLVRSNRRTLAITIDGVGHCVVRAPLLMPLGEIEGFVAEKAGWIAGKQRAIAAETLLEPPEPEFKDGAEWVICGESMRVKLVDGVPPDYAVVNGFELLCSKDLTRKDLIKFLRRFALGLLKWRVGKVAPLVGVVPGGVKISEAYARWGSCSGENILNFSWRLMFAPTQVIDYVVVHELCHIGCMNHSSHFWRRVAAVLPDYAARKKLLKQHGYLLKWFR